MSVKKEKLEINFSAHTGQNEVLNGMRKSSADIFTVDAARGWGKSIFVNCAIVLPIMLKRPNTQVQWIAPSYKICKAPIDDVWKGTDENTGKRFIPQFSPSGFKFWNFVKSDMELEIFNGSKMYMRSADNPDSIVGKGYNLIIVDEAALIDKTTFMMNILPTARRKNCKIVLISTPRGKNWFYEMYLAGQDPSKGEYLSFKQPWWKRPDYPEVLKRLMKEMPDHLRQQEFEADFIGSGGAVFKNLDKVFKGLHMAFDSQQQTWTDPNLKKADIDAEPHVIGVDLAKQQDYTVFVVMGVETGKVHKYMRMNKVDYKVITEIMKKEAQHFNNADVVFDATGVGAGVADFISSSINAYPVTFTNQMQNELVNKLILACEYENIQMPNITTIRNEFELFTYQVTRTGKISYGAPDGRHDDIVFATALANAHRQENQGTGQVDEVDEFLNTVESIRGPQSDLERLMGEDD